MRKIDKIYRLRFYNRAEKELFGLFGYPVDSTDDVTLNDCNVEKICDQIPVVWMVNIDTAVHADFEYAPEKRRRWILPDGRIKNSVCEITDIYDLDDTPSDSHEEIWRRDPEE